MPPGSDYPGAIRDYSRALEIRPDDGRLLVHRGWAYLVFDSPRLAMGDFDAAIKLDPADSDAYNGRGTAHVRLGDHRAAAADAREAIRLGKTSPRVTYNAARIYALAASVAAFARWGKRPHVRLLSSQYQDAAVRLIRDALELETPERRRSFWQGYDPDRPGPEGDPPAAKSSTSWSRPCQEAIAEGPAPGLRVHFVGSGIHVRRTRVLGVRRRRAFRCILSSTQSRRVRQRPTHSRKPSSEVFLRCSLRRMEPTSQRTTPSA